MTNKLTAKSDSDKSKQSNTKDKSIGLDMGTAKLSEPTQSIGPAGISWMENMRAAYCEHSQRSVRLLWEKRTP